METTKIAVFNEDSKILHEAMRISLKRLSKYQINICHAAHRFHCEKNICIAFVSHFGNSSYEHFRFSPVLFKKLEPFGVDLALSIRQPWEKDLKTGQNRKWLQRGL